MPNFGRTGSVMSMDTHADTVTQDRSIGGSRKKVSTTGGRDVEVTWRGRRQPARAVLVDAPELVADLQRPHAGGWQQAQRRLGIAINVRRQPTRHELSEAVRSSGLCLVRLEGLKMPRS
jgi:hypothetical protein